MQSFSPYPEPWKPVQQGKGDLWPVANQRQLPSQTPPPQTDLQTMKVRGPNNLVVNFPAGTDAATIDKVMREALQKSSLAEQAPASNSPTQSYDRPMLMRALRNAHNAGDTQAAKRIAGMITAQSADGVLHQFPAGTDPAVIDKVMKDYATKPPQVGSGPDLQTLQNAFMKAHTAGDTASAQVLATEIKRQMGTGLSQPASAQSQWSDLPSNILPSASNAVTGLASMVAHPIDTANGFDSVLTGAGLNAQSYIRSKLPDWANNASDYVDSFTDPYLGSVNPMIAAKRNPQIAAKDQALAGTMGQALKARYGGLDAIKNTAITDPVGSLLDVSTLALGGEGLLGRMGLEGSALAKTAGMLGKATNPVNAVTGTTKFAGKLATYPMGLLSGASPEAIGIAAKAGTEGGDAGHAFRMNLRGHEAPESVVHDAHGAIGNLADQRRADYLANMQATGNSGATVDTMPIWQKLNDLHDSLFVKRPANGGGNAAGYASLEKGTPEEFAKLDQMAKLLNEWEAHPEGRTPIAMDALKQRIASLQPSFTDANAGNMRRLVTEMQNAVKGEIVKVEPSYAKAMHDYETASNMKTEFERSLLLGRNTSVDATAARLKTAFNGNNANRAKNLKALEAQGAPNLGTRIAGQTLSPMMPKGAARYLATAITGGGWWNPSALSLLPMTSPRIVGEAAHLLGRGAGLLGKINPRNARLAKSLLAGQLSQSLLGGQLLESVQGQ